MKIYRAELSIPFNGDSKTLEISLFPLTSMVLLAEAELEKVYSTTDDRNRRTIKVAYFVGDRCDDIFGAAVELFKDNRGLMGP